MPKAGAIVLIPFPFTDLSETKVRPALVISSLKKGDDIIVVFISSQKERLGAYDIQIAPTKENGLKTLSTIRCAKIATLDTKILIGELGSLPSKELTRVRAVLKTIFL